MTTIDQLSRSTRSASLRIRRRRRIDPARIRGEGTSARREWRRAYVRRAMAGDALAAMVGAVVGYQVRFGPMGEGEAQPHHVAWWLLVILPGVWVLAMTVSRSYEERFLYEGPEEFRRVFFAAVMLLAATGTVSWALALEVARGFVVVALPLSAVLSLALRYAHRKWLHWHRARGQYRQTVAIVGHRGGIAALHEQIERAGYHGYHVVGCCLPAGQLGDATDTFDGLPVLGGLDEVAAVVTRYEIDTVAVLPCPEIEGPALRRLGWDLEKTRAELLLAPAVTEVAGPRVRIRPVCGLPLMHVERPELRGLRRLTKSVADRGLALLGLGLLAPVLLAVAVAVKVTSAGPVFFRQERIGRDGRPFSMLKFRSMVAGADQMSDVLSENSDGNGVLFKRREDPRVTAVGRLLRRYSLDELPQLFNVVSGSMSLVGPRPPLPSEVENYGVDMHRRFLVKPGLTGLWQVSGRSDLSWDDSVRIDVRYVENWSLTFDLMILWKTVAAVVRGSGAY